MKKIFLSVFSIVFSLSVFSQDLDIQGDTLRKINNTAFQVGEELTYRVFYESLVTGQVDAGEAKMTVREGYNVKGRETYHVVATGKSKGAFNWFFKVRDRFESVIDKEGIFSYKFVRRTREGGYKKDDDVFFDQTTHMARSRSDTMQVPPYIQDFVSAIYYSRSMSKDMILKDSGFKVNFFLDDSTYYSFVRYKGTELVRTRLGVFRCIKIAPMAATGKVFADKYPMFLWVTDDENHIPVLGEAAVIVGKVKIELINMEGIRNELKAKIPKK